MGKVRYKVLLDTNVLLDVLCVPARPSAGASQVIFQAVIDGIIEGVITTQSIMDAAYFLSRTGVHFDREAYGQCVLSLMNFLTIDSIHIFDIRDAIRNPGPDFEDDAQFEHALSEGCDAIITSDRAFLSRETDGGMLIISPDEFVGRMRS